MTIEETTTATIKPRPERGGDHPGVARDHRRRLVADRELEKAGWELAAPHGCQH